MRRAKTTTRVAAVGAPPTGTTPQPRPPAPAARPRPVESGPQRAMREADEQFRALLTNHIQDMRRRGVGEDVLGPFERELLRLGPARG